MQNWQKRLWRNAAKQWATRPYRLRPRDPKDWKFAFVASHAMSAGKQGVSLTDALYDEMHDNIVRGTSMFVRC